MTKLSVIILSESTISSAKAKKSSSFADEIIEIEIPNLTDYASARNQGLEKTKHDWVLFVDTDESVSPELAKEIKQSIRDASVNGFYLKRLDTFLGRELHHGENAKVKLLRLARKSKGKFRRPVHEIWQVKGEIGQLNNPLHHTPHKSISAFLSKINKYSTIEAEYRNKLGRRSSTWKITLYPAGKFLKNYLLLFGFLDGTPGLIMALMMSFHSFQTWTKLYLLQNKN